MRIKVNFHGIETFFVELPLRQKEAMRMIWSGKEVPDKTTKADLIRIIEFLGKKLTLTESEEELIKSNEKNQISQGDPLENGEGLSETSLLKMSILLELETRVKKSF